MPPPTRRSDVQDGVFRKSGDRSGAKATKRGCGCTAAPLFSPSASPPRRSDEANNLLESDIEGVRGGPDDRRSGRARTRKQPAASAAVPRRHGDGAIVPGAVLAVPGRHPAFPCSRTREHRRDLRRFLVVRVGTAVGHVGAPFVVAPADGRCRPGDLAGTCVRWSPFAAGASVSGTRHRRGGDDWTPDGAGDRVFDGGQLRGCSSTYGPWIGCRRGSFGSGRRDHR